MKIALDTNVLVYAAGLNDAARRARASEVIDGIDVESLVVPTQVAGEFYAALTKFGRVSPEDARVTVNMWADLIGLTPATTASVTDAIDLATDHRFQIWDALILATAAEAGCQLLLSEDVQDGFVYRGVTVANPFAETLHPLLASMLTSLSEDPR